MTEWEWLESRDPTAMMRSWLGYHACARTRWLFALACIEPITHLFPHSDFERAYEVAWRAVEDEITPAELAETWPLRDHPLVRWRRWEQSDASDPANARAVAQEAACFAIWEFGRHLPSDPTDPPRRSYDPQPPVTAAEDAALALAADTVAMARSGRGTRGAEDALSAPDLGAIFEFFGTRNDTEALRDLFAGRSAGRETVFAVAAIYGRVRARQADWVRDIFGNPFRPVEFDPTWRTSDVLLLARGIYAERAFDRMPILADALQDAGCYDDDVLRHCRECADHVRGCWVLDSILEKS